MSMDLRLLYGCLRSAQEYNTGFLVPKTKDDVLNYQNEYEVVNGLTGEYFPTFDFSWLETNQNNYFKLNAETYIMLPLMDPDTPMHQIEVKRVEEPILTRFFNNKIRRHFIEEQLGMEFSKGRIIQLMANRLMRIGTFKFYGTTNVQRVENV